MTEAENNALIEATKILKLHFPAYHVVVRETDENSKDCFHNYWHGCLAEQIGLLQIAKLRVESIAIKGTVE